VGPATQPDTGALLYGVDDGMTVKLEIPEQALRALDRKLAGLGGIHQSKALLDGMKAAGGAVRKRGIELAPRGVTEKARKGKAPLRSIPAWKIKAFVRELEPVLEVRVKAAKRAPHFHLVELGHRIVTRGGRDTGRRTKPAMFLSRGGKYSTTEQVAELKKAFDKAIKKLIGA
jgi:hypothetical protein